MAWLQASVLSSLLALCACQYPFGDTAGFEPFTNFDQYAQDRARTTNGGFRPSSQSFASPAAANNDGTYEVSRSFNYDRQSLNGVPVESPSFSSQGIQPSRYSFDEGRQLPSADQNGFRFPVSSSSPPTTERPRYYEPPAVPYQPRPLQVPTYPAPPYEQPAASRYQLPTSAPVQYQVPAAPQYVPPASPPYAAPSPPQYEAKPAPIQYQPPPQAISQPAPRQYAPPQVEAPVYEPTPRPYQPPVQQSYQPPPPTEAPYRAPAAPPPPPPPRREQYRPTQNVASSRSRNEVTEKTSVVHSPAPVHYVSIGQKLEGDYKFGYDTGKASNGDESFRRETRDPDGTVRGSYGYVDSNGKPVVVHYEAGKEGYKVLSETEAKRRAEQAVAQQQPAAQLQTPVQQYRPPVQQQVQASQSEEVPQRRIRRIKKRRRERRAVDDENESDENNVKKEFGSRVSSTGSLRPTGSPRPRPQRTSRPLNPDGRSLRPTESPIRERNVRRKVVVRTTTPLPQQASPRPTVPRRQIIPSPRVVTPPSHEEPVISPQPKRRRKVRRRFRTTVAPELQQLQAPVAHTPVSPPTAPAVPQASLQLLPQAPVQTLPPVATRAPTSQLAAHHLPLTFLQTPLTNQTNSFNSYNNNFPSHASNPYVQHVNSPQSLYDQLTSSIYQEAGRVSPSRSFVAQPQYFARNSAQQQFQPTYQNQIQYGSANYEQAAHFGQAAQYNSRFPQYQQNNFQFPQQPQFQQSRFQPSYASPQDLYSYPSNIEYGRSLLSYDIGASQ